MNNEIKHCKKAMMQLAQMGGAHTVALMDYIKLFSTPEQPLSMARTFGLLFEINEIWLDCDLTTWVAAVEQLVAQKHSGSLKTPLENHELLLDALAIVRKLQDEQPEPTQSPEPSPPPVRYATTPDPPFTQPTEEQKQKRHQANQTLLKKLNSKILSQPLKVKP